MIIIIIAIIIIINIIIIIIIITKFYSSYLLEIFYFLSVGNILIFVNIYIRRYNEETKFSSLEFCLFVREFWEFWEFCLFVISSYSKLYT